MYSVAIIDIWQELARLQAGILCLNISFCIRSHIEVKLE
jgi:hypothetical protein